MRKYSGIRAWEHEFLFLIPYFLFHQFPVFNEKPVHKFI